MPYRERKQVKINPKRVKYRNMKHVPKTIEEQNKLIDEFVVWCQIEGNNEAEDFPLSRGYNPYRFFKLAEHNAYFAQQLIHGKYILGSKIKRDVRAGNLEFNYFKEMLPLYNPEYKQFVYDRISRQRDETIKIEYEPVVKKIAIEMDEIPSLPEHHEKKETT